jgi:hypothetical protein
MSLVRRVPGEPEGIIASALTILNPNLVKLIARAGGGWVLIFDPNVPASMKNLPNEVFSLPFAIKQMTIARMNVFGLMAMWLGSGFPALAQVAPPVPSPEKVFIGNAGPGINVGQHGTPTQQYAERAYDEFFVSMKHWGHYEIVADPTRADWIFETSVSNEQTCVDRDTVRHRPGEQLEQKDDYRITLLMTDARTKLVRERFSEPIGTPNWRNSFDKLFDQTIADLMDDLKKAEVGAAAGKTPLYPHNEPTSPVPSRISLAQKIYIHNRIDPDASGERYSGGGAQVYDQFAAELKRWGRYQIVPATEADLIFEISFASPAQCDRIGDPQLQLFIRDARTDTALWAFAIHIGRAILPANARKNFAQGIAVMVAQVRDVAAMPTWALDTSLPALPAEPARVATAISNAHPAGAHPAAMDALLVSISVPSNTVKSGSSISATVIVKNATKQNFNFVYPQDDPLTCVIAVRDADGNAAKDTEEGLKIRQAHATWQGSATGYELRPREKQTRQCAVSSLFEMTAPGKYSIQVKELDGRPAESNVVTVTVQP